MNADTWPFSDQPNLAVVANRKIIVEQAWIAYVSHDLDDGGWQFHVESEELIEKNAAVVSLENVLECDPTIALLADLPLGWHAWRSSKTAAWQRARTTVDQA
ncbi:MAG TPA: hypothetical protein VNZ27_15560 [Rhodanobacter sp.]|jgi:hypothetical protein|nr:hypothetical protein [Rhodanobacter sp.]